MVKLNSLTLQDVSGDEGGFYEGAAWSNNRGGVSSWARGYSHRLCGGTVAFPIFW